MNRPVVVGVDGSPPSLVAAEYGAQAATLRSCPLHLVHGYLHPLGYGIPISPYDMGLPPPSDRARTMLERTAGELARRWPGLRVEVRQVAGGPGATLVEESRRAELVVVGSRGLGGFAGLLLGSVSTQVTAHAHCPVLVVRPADQPLPPAGPVIVGVDGSAPAQLALAHAAEEAVRRDASLVVTHVWAGGGDRPVSDERAEAETALPAEPSRLLAAVVADVRRRYPGLDVQEHLVRAPKAEQVLIDASEDAALVVVGSRGRGGFGGLLLGSVSQALVQHARCPVLVAHPHAHDGSR